MKKMEKTISASELASCLGGLTIHGAYKALEAHNIKTLKSITGRKIIPAEGIRKLFEERGFVYPKSTISFQIVKGGVGKTSLSFCLATRASHYGTRVLVIDMDQQANLTRSFDVDARSMPVWLNLFRDQLDIRSALVKVTDNIHLIPSNLNNSRLDIELIQSSANIKDIIKDIIYPIKDNYDLIIIDCPPAINKTNIAVTCASDIVMIPVTPDPYSLDGLNYTLNEIGRLRRDYKLDLDFRVVINKFDARERIGALCVQEILKNEELAGKILPGVFRVDASLKNAIFDSVSVFDLPKRAPIREDIDMFTREILDINSWKESNA